MKRNLLQRLYDFIIGKEKEPTEFPKIRASKEGKLYITTKDFFENPEIRRQIEELSNSQLVKDINKRNGL